MNPLGAVHLTLAIASLALGAAVLVLTVKGSTRHRQVGWAYAIAMLGLNVTALMIYRLFRNFGPFHVAAVLSLVTLVFGVGSALRARLARGRRDMTARGRAVQFHYHWMAYSYVGLVAAAVAETLTRLPFARPQPGAGGAFFTAVIVGSVGVFVAGAILIRRFEGAQLGRFRRQAS
jgi:uncharacterized membrane protein